jgi:integrase
MSSPTRHRNNGLRKNCDCQRRHWPKCSHSWHFNFKPKGGAGYRFSIDSEAGKHIDSKTAAEALADGWRTQIRAGAFRRGHDAVPASEGTSSRTESLTLQAFGEKYFARRGKPATNDERICMGRIAAFDGLGDKPLTAITEDDIEAFFMHLRAEGRAASTRNHYMQLAKALFRWAVRKGYLTRNPISDSDTLKREKQAKRDRRLELGEESRLLEAAGASLQRLIIAAVETCCRRGELLALQWRDVNLPRRELLIRAEEEGARKTGEGRRLPMSTRLAAVVEMARTEMITFVRSATPGGGQDVDDAALLARCYVFGDQIGRKVASTKRAWETAVLKAHGHGPQWATHGKLARVSRAALDAIDLHFHDLRHEGGSRLLEAGWPLHHVQHMLGHASASQTATYLNATRLGLIESMKRLDDSRCNPVATEEAIEQQPACNDVRTDAPNILVN